MKTQEYNKKAKVYNALWREKNREKIKAKNKRARLKRMKLIDNFKLSIGCQIKNCGWNKYAAGLDFHHIDPATKIIAIASCPTYAIATIEEEISKCCLLCATCHRGIHSGDITDIPPPLGGLAKLLV